MQYEILIYKTGRKIPSEPERWIVNAVDIIQVRKKILQKYRNVPGEYMVYPKISNKIIGMVCVFTNNSKTWANAYYGKYVWQKPQNAYNGKQEFWAVNPNTGKLVRK